MVKNFIKIIKNIFYQYHIFICRSEDKTGVHCGEQFVSFKSIHADVRAAVDHVHIYGGLKKLTVENPEHYVIKDDKLPQLLNIMRENGKKVFLLTNSEYWYTDVGQLQM